MLALPLRLSALCATVLAVTACGGGSAEADVRETVSGYFVALSKRDFAGACARVSPAFETELVSYARRAFPDFASTDCEPIARRIAEANGDRLVGLQNQVEVRSAEVDGDSATAQLGPGQVATLEQIDGDWLIAKLDFTGATGTTPP